MAGRKAKRFVVVNPETAEVWGEFRNAAKAWAEAALANVVESTDAFDVIAA